MFSLLGIMLDWRLTLYLKAEPLAHFNFRIYTIIRALSEFDQFVGIFPSFESCQRAEIPTRSWNSASLSVFFPRSAPVNGPEYRQDHGIRPACRCWMFTAGWKKPGTRERVRFSSETRQIGIEREKEGHGGTVKSGRTEKGRISAP